jgi:lipoyl-dependent peroxiredoxin
MALTSEATTVWNGDLISGEGTTTLDSSQLAEFRVNWRARTEGQTSTTNPEELLGAAHAACYSMQLAGTLANAGFQPTSIQTTAAVTFAVGTGVVGSHLLVDADVPGISEEQFMALAEDAKVNCPISLALAAIPITLEAELA